MDCEHAIIYLRGSPWQHKVVTKLAQGELDPRCAVLRNFKEKESRHILSFFWFYAYGALERVVVSPSRFGGMVATSTFPHYMGMTSNAECIPALAPLLSELNTAQKCKKCYAACLFPSKAELPKELCAPFDNVVKRVRKLGCRVVLDGASDVVGGERLFAGSFLKGLGEEPRRLLLNTYSDQLGTTPSGFLYFLWAFSASAEPHSARAPYLWSLADPYAFLHPFDKLAKAVRVLKASFAAEFVTQTLQSVEAGAVAKRHFAHMIPIFFKHLPRVVRAEFPSLPLASCLALPTSSPRDQTCVRVCGTADAIEVFASTNPTAHGMSVPDKYLTWLRLLTVACNPAGARTHGPYTTRGYPVRSVVVRNRDWFALGDMFWRRTKGTRSFRPLQSLARMLLGAVEAGDGTSKMRERMAEINSLVTLGAMSSAPEVPGVDVSCLTPVLAKPSRTYPAVACSEFYRTVLSMALRRTLEQLQRQCDAECECEYLLAISRIIARQCSTDEALARRCVGELSTCAVPEVIGLFVKEFSSATPAESPQLSGIADVLRRVTTRADTLKGARTFAKRVAQSSNAAARFCGSIGLGRNTLVAPLKELENKLHDQAATRRILRNWRAVDKPFNSTPLLRVCIACARRYKTIPLRHENALSIFPFSHPLSLLAWKPWVVTLSVNPSRFPAAVMCIQELGSVRLSEHPFFASLATSPEAARRFGSVAQTSFKLMLKGFRDVASSGKYFYDEDEGAYDKEKKTRIANVCDRVRDLQAIGAFDACAVLLASLIIYPFCFFDEYPKHVRRSFQFAVSLGLRLFAPEHAPAWRQAAVQDSWNRGPTSRETLLDLRCLEAMSGLGDANCLMLMANWAFRATKCARAEVTMAALAPFVRRLNDEFGCDAILPFTHVLSMHVARVHSAAEAAGLRIAFVAPPIHFVDMEDFSIFSKPIYAQPGARKGTEEVFKSAYNALRAALAGAAPPAVRVVLDFVFVAAKEDSLEHERRALAEVGDIFPGYLGTSDLTTDAFLQCRLVYNFQRCATVLVEFRDELPAHVMPLSFLLARVYREYGERSASLRSCYKFSSPPHKCYWKLGPSLPLLKFNVRPYHLEATILRVLFRDLALCTPATAAAREELTDAFVPLIPKPKSPLRAFVEYAAIICGLNNKYVKNKRLWKPTDRDSRRANRFLSAFPVRQTLLSLIDSGAVSSAPFLSVSFRSERRRRVPALTLSGDAFAPAPDIPQNAIWLHFAAAHFLEFRRTASDVAFAEFAQCLHIFTFFEYLMNKQAHGRASLQAVLRLFLTPDLDPPAYGAPRWAGRLTRARVMRLVSQLCSGRPAQGAVYGPEFECWVENCFDHCIKTRYFMHSSQDPPADQYRLAIIRAVSDVPLENLAPVLVTSSLRLFVECLVDRDLAGPLPNEGGCARAPWSGLLEALDVPRLNRIRRYLAAAPRGGPDEARDTRDELQNLCCALVASDAVLTENGSMVVLSEDGESSMTTKSPVGTFSFLELCYVYRRAPLTISASAASIAQLLAFADGVQAEQGSRSDGVARLALAPGSAANVHRSVEYLLAQVAPEARRTLPAELREKTKDFAQRCPFCRFFFAKTASAKDVKRALRELPQFQDLSKMSLAELRALEQVALDGAPQNWTTDAVQRLTKKVFSKPFATRNVCAFVSYADTYLDRRQYTHADSFAQLLMFEVFASLFGLGCAPTSLGEAARANSPQNASTPADALLELLKLQRNSSRAQELLEIVCRARGESVAPLGPTALGVYSKLFAAHADYEFSAAAGLTLHNPDAVPPNIRNFWKLAVWKISLAFYPESECAELLRGLRTAFPAFYAGFLENHVVRIMAARPQARVLFPFCYDARASFVREMRQYHPPGMKALPEALDERFLFLALVGFPDAALGFFAMPDQRGKMARAIVRMGEPVLATLAEWLCRRAAEFVLDALEELALDSEEAQRRGGFRAHLQERWEGYSIRHTMLKPLELLGNPLAATAPLSTHVQLDEFVAKLAAVLRRPHFRETFPGGLQVYVPGRRRCISAADEPHALRDAMLTNYREHGIEYDFSEVYALFDHIEEFIWRSRAYYFTAMTEHFLLAPPPDAAAATPPYFAEATARWEQFTAEVRRKTESGFDAFKEQFAAAAREWGDASCVFSADREFCARIEPARLQFALRPHEFCVGCLEGLPFDARLCHRTTAAPYVDPIRVSFFYRGRAIGARGARMMPFFMAPASVLPGKVPVIQLCEFPVAFHHAWEGGDGALRRRSYTLENLCVSQIRLGASDVTLGPPLALDAALRKYVSSTEGAAPAHTLAACTRSHVLPPFGQFALLPRSVVAHFDTDTDDNDAPARGAAECLRSAHLSHIVCTLSGHALRVVLEKLVMLDP
eukprot:gnl/Chilomastix_cuspidata/1645.p1 GENE.gnl/Chilomastix_cuspidata/1645~~gnl/Chilomastix_cuspidata/1645.p1  ORF type:complete len:2377 (-),score=606.02 gnl/Chilomastix_cuspidata/1645:827-7924(-)